MLYKRIRNDQWMDAVCLLISYLFLSIHLEAAISYNVKI
jgi:hypothetical protein